MKYMYTIVIVSVLLVGCGYKDAPIYVDKKTDKQK